MDRDQLRASYDANARRRAAFPLPAWRVAARDGWIGQLTQARARCIVDLGGATGVDALAFAEAGFEVTVVDLSPVHVEIAAEHGLTAVEADISDTGLPEGVFDAAWSASTFMHLPDGAFEAALDEVVRLVRPGGLVQIGLWGGVDEVERWEDDFQDPPRTFVHRSDDVVRRLAGRVLDLVELRTEQTGYRPDLHYQWISGRRRDPDVTPPD